MLDAGKQVHRSSTSRYVLKSNGADAPTFVGRHPGRRDVQAVLASGGALVGASFILMDFIDGVEMGVGAYFNGERLSRTRLPRLGTQALLPRRSR